MSILGLGLALSYGGRAKKTGPSGWTLVLLALLAFALGTAIKSCH